jgi:hypothetical protein
MIAVLLAGLASVSASESRLHPSPFLPPPGDPSAPVATAAAKDSLEFTGVIVTGKTVLLNLTDTQAKKSFWIGIGKSDNGVEAVDYDRRQDAATLKVRGETSRDEAARGGRQLRDQCGHGSHRTGRPTAAPINAG